MVSTTTHPPAKDNVFAGYLTHQGVRIQIDFQAPIGATRVQIDAAFFSALQDKVEINYLVLGTT